MKHIKYALLCAVLLLLTACGGNSAENSETANRYPEITVPDAGDTIPASNMANPTAEHSTGDDETTNYHLEIAAPDTGDTSLEFYIVNAAGEDAEILLIPTLEIRNADGEWETVSLDDRIGFCGTKDPLPVGKKSWSLAMDELWNNLYKGEYRLSFTVTDAEGREFTASGEFSLTYDIIQIARI